MPQAFFLITVLASTLTLAAAPVARAQSDPAILLKQYVEAINRGDAAGALAMLADDAVFDVPGGLCMAAPCVSKATIQKELESRNRAMPVLQALGEMLAKPGSFETL